jgi:hypothetical protein
MGNGRRMTDDPELADTAGDDHKTLLERLRDTGVGMEDPNIAGDPHPDDDGDEDSLVEYAEPGEEDTIEP